MSRELDDLGVIAGEIAPDHRGIITVRARRVKDFAR